MSNAVQANMMSDSMRLMRLELMAQFHWKDIQQLMMNGTEMQIDLALKQKEVDDLTAQLVAVRDELEKLKADLAALTMPAPTVPPTETNNDPGNSTGSI